MFFCSVLQLQTLLTISIKGQFLFLVPVPENLSSEWPAFYCECKSAIKDAIMANLLHIAHAFVYTVYIIQQGLKG